MADSGSIRLARREEAASALRLVLSACGAEERDALSAQLLGELALTNSCVEGLFTFVEGEELRGATLAQPHPGRTGSVWRPRFVDEHSASAAVELVRRASEAIFARGDQLAQTLLEADDSAAKWFLAAGFEPLARLAYLIWPASISQTTNFDQGTLRFHTTTSLGEDVLSRLVEESYVDTRDCPALNGARTTADVLAGYRAIGLFRPHLWLIAELADVPVGCLLMADHAASNQCELVYMGVTPQARGQGLGAEIVRKAQDVTRSLGRGRLVLAVDTANAPALAIYDRAGFLAWQERDVYVRFT